MSFQYFEIRNMKKYFHLLCLVLSLLAKQSLGQSNMPVRVTFTMVPPYPNKLTDLGEQPGKVIITLQNLWQTPITVFLRCTITNENGISAYTDPNYIPPTRVTLQPNQVVQADYNTIRDLFDANHLKIQGTTLREITRRQGMPEGNYEICVRAYEIQRMAVPVSDPAPFGCGQFRLVSLEPPILIKPLEDEEIQYFTPQNIVFSWTIPPGAEPGTRYRLRVVEMLDPKRNINDAIQTAYQPVFFETTVQGNIYVYSSADPPMVPGRKYAWAVTALDESYNGRSIEKNGSAFRNGGQSEVRGFVVSDPNKGKEPQIGDRAVVKIPKNSRVKFTPDLTKRLLNKNSFKGKLVYAFRKTEKGVLNDPGPTASSSATPVHFETTSVPQLSSFIENSSSNFLNLPLTGAYSSTNPSGKPKSGGSGGTPIAGGSSTGSGISKGRMVISGSPAAANLSMIGGIEIGPKDYQDELQQKIESLADEQHYGLANTEVQLQLRFNPQLGKKQKAANPLAKQTPLILLGKVKTDGDGNFNIDYAGELETGYELELIINNPYFEFANVGIRIQTDTNGVYDVGEILGLAKTYRLKVNVTDEDGNKLDSAKIEILRQSGYYDKNVAQKSLDHEVLHDQYKDSVVSDYGERQTMGKVLGASSVAASFKMELAGKGSNGNVFTRMFVGNSWSDVYYLRVSLDTTVSKTFTNYVLNEEGSYVEKGIPVIEKTYKLPMAAPYVKGRVIATNGAIPIKGATVMVAIQKSGTDKPSDKEAALTRTATTDEQGRFNIENIQPSDIPYAITVLYKSKSFTQTQAIYLSRRGMHEDRDPIEVPAALTTVCGSVQDNEAVPVANAALHWKEGGEVFYSDEDGKFITSQTEGKHTLIVMSPGYKDKSIEIEVKENTGKAGTVLELSDLNKQATVADWAKINFGSTAKLLGTKPATVAPAITINNSLIKMSGTGTKGAFVNGITAQQAMFGKVFGTGEIVSTAASCDHVIVLTKFYVKATVTDATTKAPVKDALISVEGGTKKFTTDAAGIAVLSDVPSGSPKIITSGPADKMYETSGNIITVDNSQDTISIQIALHAGSKASGKVLAGGTPLKNAAVFVDGKSFIKDSTDNDGNYTLSGVPAGEYKLVASKSGMLSDDSTLNFVANTSYAVNFSLKDPGFNASSLYGFPIILDASAPGAAPNEFVITGRIADIPENSGTLFKKDGPVDELKFYNITIVKDGDHIYAKDGQVKLDASEISLKAWEYLKVRLEKSDGLILKGNGSDYTKGEIAGEVIVDLNASFPMLAGWQAPSASIKLTAGGATLVGAITSTGNFTGTGIKMSCEAESFKVYTVTVKPDWANSEIGTSGFNFKGELKVEGIPMLSTLKLNLNKVSINKNGKVTAVDAAITEPKPEISLLTWKLQINSLDINNTGLRFGGDMTVPIPGSSDTHIGFSDLVFNSSGIGGGSFFLPSAGIDVFSLIKFKAPAGSMFSLQKIPGTTAYQIIGAGTFSLPKLINKELQLESFNISTNGNFGAVAKTDFTVGFSDMANLTISKVGFDIGKKQIDIGGKFKLNIPGFGIGADGSVHYKPGSVWVDELGVNFNLSAAVGVAAKVSFKNENEFSGEGSLKLAGVTDGVGLGFHYKKLTGGIDVGATFKTGVVIPIGVVKLDKVGGGFDLNTATSTYTVFASGRITLAPDPAGVVALDPVKITITSTPAGPTLLGEATAKLMDSWTVGKVELKIDYPNKLFYIDGKFGGGFTLVKGIGVNATAGLHVEASAQSSPYWFIVGSTNTDIAHIFNSNVTIMGGWNVERAAHAELSGIPDYMLYGGRIYGGYFGTTVGLNYNSPEIGVKGIATVKGWYHNNSALEVYANFKGAAYGIKFSGDWNAGGEASFAGMGIAGCDIAVNGGFEGYYNSGTWSINGNLGAGVNAHIGCDGDCNGITWGCCFDPCFWDSCEICPCPCGAKVCVNGSLQIGYSSASGFSFGLNL
jgi:TANFOR domain-containing protein